jgi:hypothetical protein
VIVVTLLAAAVFLPLATVRGDADTTPGAVALTAFLVLAYALLLHRGHLLSRTEQTDPRVADRRYLAFLILSGFVLRVVIAAGLRQFGLNDVIAPDEGTFHANGLQFCRWLQGDTPYRVSYRLLDSIQVGYFYFIGTIYYVIGVTPFVPVLFNCLFGALVALPVFRITRDLHSREAARVAALLVVFFPSVLLWSTMLLRDSLVILIMLMIVVTVMELRKGLSILRIALFLGLLMLLGTLRQYLFIMVAASAVSSFVLGRTGRTARSLAVGVLVILGLVMVMRIAGFGLWELERASLFHLNQRRQYNAMVDAAGSIAPEVDISEPISALTWLPVGMVYFLGSPFPWQVLSPRQIMALPDVLTWYLLLPGIFIGLLHVIRNRFRDASMLLITMAVITILYSLIEGNVGIIFRHRAQIIAPAMVFAGIGVSIRAARKKKEKEALLVSLKPAEVPG